MTSPSNEEKAYTASTNRNVRVRPNERLLSMLPQAAVVCGIVGVIIGANRSFLRVKPHAIRRVKEHIEIAKSAGRIADSKELSRVYVHSFPKPMLREALRTGGTFLLFGTISAGGVYCISGLRGVDDGLNFALMGALQGSILGFKYNGVRGIPLLGVYGTLIGGVAGAFYHLEIYWQQRVNQRMKEKEERRRKEEAMSTVMDELATDVKEVVTERDGLDAPNNKREES